MTDNAPTIRPKGPFPTLDTPIGQWPMEWLRRIEPLIERTTIADGNHWFWGGYFKGVYPTLGWRDAGTGKMVHKAVTKIIGRLFWHIPPELTEYQWVCRPICGFENCVNPRHLAAKIKEGPYS